MRFVCLLLLTFLWSVKLLNGVRMPRFKYADTQNVVIGAADVWQAGQPDKIAILHYSEIKLKIEVEGGEDCYKKSLLIWCNSSEDGIPADRTIALSILEDNVVSPKICSGTFPFTLKRNSDEYWLALPETAPASNLNALTLKLKIRASVNCKNVNLMSKSLFVMNPGGLLSINNKEEIISGKRLNRRILTQDGAKIFFAVNATKDFSSVDFIDSSVTKAIKTAPEFLRNNLHVGGVRNFRITESDSCTVNNENQYPIINAITYTNSLNKYSFVDMETGKLHFARHTFTKQISRTFRKFGDLGQITSLLCAAMIYSRTGVYSATNAMQLVTRGVETINVLGSTTYACKLTVDSKTKSVTAFSGFQSLLLKCPIICNDPLISFTFTHNSRNLENICGSPTGWCKHNGIRIYKDGNVVWLPNLVNKSHSGSYTCSAGGKSFTYDVTVFTLPYFLNSGRLPERIFAMEGEFVSYNCSAAFSNVGSIDVETEFWMENKNEKIWTKYDVNSFNQLVQHTQNNELNKLTVTKQKTEETIGVTATVESVPAALKDVNRDFTHRFVCRVTVGEADAKKVGMKTFSVESGSDVFFVPRLTSSDFDQSTACSSGRECRVGDSATVTVSIRGQVSQRLRDIGVRVEGHFRIGDFKLEEVTGMRELAVFDAESNRLTLSLNSWNVTASMIEKLRGNVSLLAEFEFSYPEGSNVQNLRMKKSATDASVNSCQSRSLCFYSTRVQVDNSMSFLAIPTAERASVVKDGVIIVDKYTILGAVIVLSVLTIVTVLTVVYLVSYTPKNESATRKKTKTEQTSTSAEAGRDGQ